MDINENNQTAAASAIKNGKLVQSSSYQCVFNERIAFDSSRLVLSLSDDGEVRD